MASLYGQPRAVTYDPGHGTGPLSLSVGDTTACFVATTLYARLSLRPLSTICTHQSK
jgi:hypothetical protein